MDDAPGNAESMFLHQMLGSWCFTAVVEVTDFTPSTCEHARCFLPFSNDTSFSLTSYVPSGVKPYSL